MLATWLTLFIIITFIALLLSAYLMENNPPMSIPFILIGVLFSILCSYGMLDVEFVVMRSDNTVLTESFNYGEPYSYVFVFIFFIFIMFFFRAAWNMLQESLKTKGEFRYTQNRNYFR